MEFEKLTKERQSIRSYAEKSVPAELIEKVLRTAQAAPSWKNSQTARCYVVTSEKYAEIRHEILPEGNAKKAKNAVLIITAFVKDTAGFTDGNPDNDGGNFWGAYDLGLHDALLVLAAKDNGLDTLIMGLRNADKIREILEIPENEQIMSVIALGYRDENPPARPRKPLEEVIVYK